MTQNWQSRYWKFMKASAFFMGGAFAFFGNRTLAQTIVPDATLGAERSVVTPGVDVGGVPADRIEGGAVRGINLFHSFSQFNVGELQRVYFANPSGIINILSRVTGNNPSKILGTLGVTGGNANLFLINPNGIVFGANAHLNVGGSFVASTASAVKFADGTQFTAAPPTTPLLTISVPMGLQYGGNAGKIQVQGASLALQPGKTLALVGGDVSLDGGSLQAPGGRVELGGLSGAGTVGIDTGVAPLRFPDNVARADVSLTNGATVNVQAGGGGSISINAQNLNLAGESKLRAGIASKLGSVDSKAGNIEINATGVIKLSDSSFIGNVVQEGAVGNAGNITIDAGSLSLRDGAQLAADTNGQGNAGNVTVQVRDSVSLANASINSRVQPSAVGKGGNIDINATTLSLTDGAQLITHTSRAFKTQPAGRGDAGNININVTDAIDIAGIRDQTHSGIFSYLGTGAVGNGGNITIEAGSLSLQAGAQLAADTNGQGNAGNVTVRVRDSVSLVNGRISSRVQPSAVGEGGDIDINAATLSLTDGAQLVTRTSGAFKTQPAGRGDAGNININVTDAIDIAGIRDQTHSGIFSYLGTGAVGNGGNITIDAGSFSLRDGAQLAADTNGQGNAGNVTVKTGELIVQNGAQVSAKTSGTGRAGTLLVNATDSVTVDGKNSHLNFDTGSQGGDAGDAGNLTISTQRLVVRNGAQVSARSSGAGDAGTLLVNATDSVTVDGKDSRLRFDTEGSGNAKGIRIETERLVVQNGGQVTVSGTGTGNPGNLDVTAGSVFLNNQGGLDQRGLIAETKSGEGGNIRLQVQDTLLMRYQSLISASAEGTGNGGNIEIEAPNGLIVAILSENSDIVASAIQGNGGIARAKAAGVFGFRQFRGFRTPESDFTASSELGIDGRLEIITPDRRFEELPANFETAEIAQGCEAVRGPEGSSFVVTGRGGLPPNPGEALSTDAVQVNLITLKPEVEKPSTPAVSTNSTSSAPAQLVEAQGWVIDANGKVVLTSFASTLTPHSSWQKTANCQKLN